VDKKCSTCLNFKGFAECRKCNPTHSNWKQNTPEPETYSYIIWFNSGQSIEGTMDKENISDLGELFLLREGVSKTHLLNDSDGELMLDIHQVAAISTSVLIPDKQPCF